MNRRFGAGLSGSIGTLLLLAGTLFAQERIEFNRTVRPILAEHCFECHGPDAGAQKAGRRLDSREGATAVLPSGSVAVVPGDPESSELIARIEADETLRMPPADQGRHGLTPAQINTLRTWVNQGAAYERHWSLVAPTRAVVPEVRDTAWPRNPIDRFVLAALEGRSLYPSQEADRVTLIRRVTLDLIGLPPTPEEVDAFRNNPAPDAYERLVERLLSSPQHGERMATAWLDLVRFADTVGYHSDVDRSVALYRDYVIRAFNENLPYDRFTIEQLAGDLLPEPTDWQLVASAYNMLGMTTEEGGAQAREYLARHAADRVRNLGSVWMGATLGCAECHDHKYDPYSTRDFYALAAFFADLQQEGVGTPKPTLAMPTREQSRAWARLDAREAAGADPGVIVAERKALEASIRRTIIARPGPPRVTRVLARGDWMDDTGEIVSPAIPRAFGTLGVVSGLRPTRLDLARWLTSAEQPQTARVAVNRLWRQFFGVGLSDSPDDLGTRGEWPTHPQLLDWLAVEFRENGWDIRHIIRLIVTSATYRQASSPRDDLAAVDPGNQLLGRQNAFRLEAEVIRDQALAASGLLVQRLGGESVKPYQPAGYWRFLNFPKREYVASRGNDQYRRGLYTHWQRTLLHPSLLALDAPSREQCTAKRPISNTPQAALVLLNDPSYVEAARALAERTMRTEVEDGPRLICLWRLVLARPPDDTEQGILASLLARHRRDFAADPDSAQKLLAVGEFQADPAIDPAELAAWTSVARAVLNLDETITRD
jgi:hypothetical protein